MDCSSHYDITYHRTLEQFDPNQQYQFGEKANVLILTDRLMGYADGIYEFLSLHQDLTVYQVRSLADVEQALAKCKPDILLIVGCLANSDLYDSIDLLKRANPYVCNVLYARADDCTDTHMLYHHIEFLFHRDQPLAMLPVFLREVMAKKKLEKEQHRQQAVVQTQKEQKKSPHKNIFLNLLTHFHSKKNTAIY